MTDEHFDEAFAFAVKLGEARQRRVDPVYAAPEEKPNEWYERRLREVREKNFAQPEIGRLVPRFVVDRGFDKLPAEVGIIGGQWPSSQRDWTLIATREYEALRALEKAVIANQNYIDVTASDRPICGNNFQSILEAIRKARE